MKTMLLPLLTSLVLVFGASISFAEKTCPDEFIWDEIEGKCVLKDFHGGSRSY